MLGTLLAEYPISVLNLTGTILVAAIAFIASVYLISTFSMSRLAVWFAGPIRWWRSLGEGFARWLAKKRRIAMERAQQRAGKRGSRAAKTTTEAKPASAAVADTTPPFDVEEPEPESEELKEIPIHALEYDTPAPASAAAAPLPDPAPVAARVKRAEPEPLRPHVYELPPTELLNEIPGRNAYDSQELKEIAARIKSKFEEFNVLGSVVQINPGPVVTTFELKPEAGVKYSRITTLTEDLCLGLQAESILIERIPGKPTVGIEVPNTRREVISLRQILESEEFRTSPSKMTICLGKDINGRIRSARSNRCRTC